MAYFLKKSNLKKGTYLQIYESFYDPRKKNTAHRSYKALGYVHELQEKGIEDPVAFFKDEVARLNQQLAEQRQSEKDLQISEETPEKLLGYFPLKNLNDSLDVKKYIDLMQTATDFKFHVFSLLSSLIYSRAVCPCSKAKTFDEVLPKLYEPARFSLNQLYAGLEYLGSEYEKIIEIYNHQINRKYPFDTSHTYFDCTNFYFEIDREDDFRRKGPSKENRKDPIVGMGLLLDAHQIPIGMKVYPGNESEKPVIRKVIDDLKSRNNISGKTIQVADKGLKLFGKYPPCSKIRRWISFLQVCKNSFRKQSRSGFYWKMITGMSKTKRGIFFIGSKSASMIFHINTRTNRGGKRLYGYRKNE